MNDKRQYVWVGLFIVIAVTITVTVWLWFQASNRKVYNIYQTTFSEPVDGISNNSPVKYNGVEVGKVRSIELDRTNPRDVIVTLNILANVPINKQTVSSVRAQGVTGLSFVDLRLPNNNTLPLTENLVPHNTPPYPVIINHPSLLYSLTEQAQVLTNNVQDISAQMKLVLAEKNIQHFSNILANLDKVSNALAQKTNDIDKGMNALLDVLQNVKQNSIKLNETFDNLNVLTKSLAKTSNNTNNLISNTNSLITNVQDNTLENVNSVLLPNLNQTITNLNLVSQQMQQFLTTLNQNPSVLVRGKISSPKGPGE
jgi:phospholipid/cholesterol/gamma-HCH transport system substrate-binding protein